MAVTFLRSATNRPVRYSAKCPRCGSLANRSPNCCRASRTTCGYSTMAGMRHPHGADQPDHLSPACVRKLPRVAMLYICFARSQFDRVTGRPVAAEEVGQRLTTHVDKLAEVVAEAG